MKMELFKIGSLSVHGYGFMIGIGFIIALFLGEFRAKRKNMKDEAVIDLAIIAGVTGFIGAKILYIIVSFKEFMVNPLAVIGSEGFVVYGGIISGVLCCYLYCRVKKLSFMEYFDLVMPEVAVAQGFGRIGCFLAGCCYGRETDSVFGVVFPENSLAPAGVKLIPTQLISTAGNFIIAFVLIILADVVFKKRNEAEARINVSGNDEISQNAGNGRRLRYGSVPGDIGCTYMLLYGIGRFLVEFLRNDYRGEIGFMSTSQFISVFIVIGSAVLYVINHKNTKAAVMTRA